LRHARYRRHQLGFRGRDAWRENCALEHLDRIVFCFWDEEQPYRALEFPKGLRFEAASLQSSPAGPRVGS
jgi:hypothetical protein